MTAQPFLKQPDVDIEMRDLEELAAKLLDTARKLPPGPVRYDSLKEIGQLRVRMDALRAKSEMRISMASVRGL